MTQQTKKMTPKTRNDSMLRKNLGNLIYVVGIAK